MPAEVLERAESSRPNLVVAAEEFRRCWAGLDASDSSPVAYHRVREVAIAACDLMKELLRAAGYDTDGGWREVVASMRSLAGADQELADAVETLAGLTNAHIFAVMDPPPAGPLRDGRAAGLLVAAFVDSLVGDEYRARV